jgi:SAM-dependent methyltransferase
VRAEFRRRRKARWGNLRREQPFSDRYGTDRGTPVDRALLARFFAAHAPDITGRVLEVRDPGYTRRYGAGITDVDIVDIDPTNPRVTVLADLAEPGSLPAGSWDCIVVPQTVQLVADMRSAVANLWRALAPGGVLLVTVPCVARCDPTRPEIDRWRVLPAGLELLLRDGCPGADVTVTLYGNLVTTMAFLLGLAAEELDAGELDRVDASHPVLACGRARRPEER